MPKYKNNENGRTRAVVDLTKIKKNLEVLASFAKKDYVEWKGAVPMVKANAYGHGLLPVALHLQSARDVLGVGVATLNEGVSLRAGGFKKPIWVFSEAALLTDDLCGLIENYRLTPVLHRVEDLSVWLKRAQKRGAKYHPFHLKFNTGMNRLGIAAERAAEVAGLCARARVKVEGLCSHFALAEEPLHETTQSQARVFSLVVSAFAAHDISYIHGGNSAAILGESKLGIGEFCNVVRPGLGIYGYSYATDPVAKKLAMKLQPALTWQARVLSARILTRGDQVGYGYTYTAEKKLSQVVLGVGYGDGLFRSLANQKILVSAGHKKKALVSSQVLGRVSMDLSSVESSAKVGEWVTLLGHHQEQGLALAQASGTIVYELLTSLSPRVERVYS